MQRLFALSSVSRLETAFHAPGSSGRTHRGSALFRPSQHRRWHRILPVGLVLGLCLLGAVHARAQGVVLSAGDPAPAVLPPSELVLGEDQTMPPTDVRELEPPSADGRILQAVREGQENGGRYPVVANGLSHRVPFGYQKPTLYCQPLRSSLIRLEPGETVWAAIPADPVSWSVQLSQSGPGGITPIVVVKPLTEAAIVTNLFISTDRRIYEVLLQSGGPEASRHLASATQSSILEFYYPEDVIRSVAVATAGQQQRAATLRSRATTAPMEVSRGIPLDRMRFTYTWKKDRRFPWAPVSVFDDGAHVYITLPADARHEAGAALFVRGLNGEYTMLEYAVREGRIVTDRVFREAQFVYAEPSSQKRPKKVVLTITNTAR